MAKTKETNKLKINIKMFQDVRVLFCQSEQVILKTFDILIPEMN